MVEIVGLEDILANHPFAHDLPPDVLRTITGCCSNAVYHPGEYIFREGEPADHFFLIRHGLVALEIHVPQGSPIVVETLETGDIFGWSWLVPPYVWTNDARASEQVRLLKLDGACLRGKMESDRALGYEIYKRFLPVMARRLATTRLRIVELATEPPAHPRHRG
ncbi:MAG TPA: cyclic nucleotide-binding domain-containing protein [Rhodopila sp.]